MSRKGVRVVRSEKRKVRIEIKCCKKTLWEIVLVESGSRTVKITSKGTKVQ